MRGVNYVCLSGNLGADPELRHTSTGRKVAELRLATGRKSKKDGELVLETQWTIIKAWEHQAEFAARYLHKGDPVIVQGRLHTEKWTSSTGEPRSRVTVIASEVNALPRPKSDSRPDSPRSSEPAPTGPPSTGQVIPF
jgi:single-strand DNA-binding protein